MYIDGFAELLEHYGIVDKLFADYVKGELHVSRLHCAQPGLGQHVLNCEVFKK